MINATIKAGTIITAVETGFPTIVMIDIRVHARILIDDIEITEFRYKGVWYTVYTSQVFWD